MRISSSFVILAAPLAAIAAPRFYGKRTASANDILVFQFADVLEQLESQFYAAALSKFQENDFVVAGFSQATVAIQQFQTIQSDESTHDTALQAAIQSFGASPVSSCSFNFDSVLTDVTTLAATARVVENLGVAAYLGGATLLDDPVLLDSAASILTVEARHQTILNVFSGTGSAIPSAFDIPFTPSEVLAIASPFISGCDLGIKANPSLTITNTGTVAPGTLLTFSSSALNSGSENGLFCQMLVGGNPISIALPLSQCIVPDGINGPVAIFITSDGQPLVNNVRDRATTQLVAGPTMAFIDTQPQLIGTMVRTVSGSSSSSSNSSSSGESSSSSSSSGSASSTESSSESITTTTISNDEASSIIAGASSTAAASQATATATESSSPSSGAENGSSSNNVGASSTPNMSTGPSQDGHITVDGWMNLPSN